MEAAMSHPLTILFCLGWVKGLQRFERVPRGSGCARLGEIGWLTYGETCADFIEREV